MAPIPGIIIPGAREKDLHPYIHNALVGGHQISEVNNFSYDHNFGPSMTHEV
jgi:hypothetical protein